MENQVTKSNYLYVKSKDHSGRTVHTEVFKQADGLFKAFSYYTLGKNEDFVEIRVAKSYDDRVAIFLSIENLTKRGN